MGEDIRESFLNTEVAFAARSDGQLKKANLLFTVVNSPWMSKLSTAMVRIGFALGLPVEGLIRSTVFQHFCGGITIPDSLPTVRHLARFNVKTILDYSVEGGADEEGFEKTTEEIIRTVENAGNTSEIPFAVFKVTGIASSKILEKVQLGRPLTDEEKRRYERIRNRIGRICKRGFELDVPVFIDAEHSWYQDPIDDIAYENMQAFNKEKAIVFNTYQMYRKDMLGNLKAAHQKAARDQYYLGAKLVRGAYMEVERERAHEKGYPDPIHNSKEDTDQSFNDALRFCINEKQRISVVCGSHNEYSNYYLTLLMEKHGLKRDDDRVYFSQLYGMSDNISFNLASKGYNVAKYVPYGPVRAVMPYLFRRAEENTSIAGQSSRELRMIRSELKRRKNQHK